MRIAIVMCIAVLTACGGPQTTLTTKPDRTTEDDNAAIAAGIGGQMKDPMSVQYRAVRSYVTSGDQRIHCGEYNAKNSFGAYTGFKPFYVRSMGSTPLRSLAGTGELFPDVSIEQNCVGAARGSIVSSGPL